MTEYSSLLSAIEKAVPDSLGREKSLEDVLRALGYGWEVSVDQKSTVNFWKRSTSEVAANRIEERWHLGHDLAWHKENAPETITFLHSLLCQK